LKCILTSSFQTSISSLYMNIILSHCYRTYNRVKVASISRVAKHHTICAKCFHLPAGQDPPPLDVQRYSVPCSLSARQLKCSKTWWPGHNCPRYWNCTWNMQIHSGYLTGILLFA
jgi:hypothetical protein